MLRLHFGFGLHRLCRSLLSYHWFEVLHSRLQYLQPCEHLLSLRRRLLSSLLSLHDLSGRLCHLQQRYHLSNLHNWLFAVKLEVLFPRMR